MTKPFFIRSAMESDIPAIRTVLVDTWHETYDQSMGVEQANELLNLWHSPERIKDRLSKPHSEFLVADNGEEIGGMAFASVPAKDKRITLNQLYVLPKFQGQKAGLHLLVEIENSFPECTHIELEVDANNKQAISFYTAYGFAMIGKGEHCMEEGSNIPTILMEKPIVYVDG